MAVIPERENNEHIALNKIYLEDCMVGMKRIPDQSIDMILCDLPYGTTQHDWDTILPIEEMWAEYNRIIKPEGSIVLFSLEPFTTKLRYHNLQDFKYELIWDKQVGANFAQVADRPLKTHEVISVFRRDTSEKTYNPQGLKEINKTVKNKNTGYLGGNKISGKGDTYTQKYTNHPKSILRFKKDDGFHPTQKPVALFKYLIETYSNKGDIVLDNCMGSCTTAVAALDTGRFFIGFETCEEYFEKGQRRIADYLLNKITVDMAQYYELLYEAEDEEDFDVDIETEEVEDEEVFTTELNIEEIEVDENE